ncbi:hypothetical protein ACM1ZW_12670 [Pseudomonas sp. NFX71]|uniref:hypothetical protein n=1 Tax=Pseudomonas sp. NFX71 TaxID=3399121 RepID=UPI003A88E47C
MKLLRYQENREYMGALREVRSSWFRCQRAFEDLTEIWLANCNLSTGAIEMSLERQGEFELAGKFMDKPFTVRCVAKVKERGCLGQVLVFSPHSVTAENVLILCFYLDQQGDLISEDGTTVGTAGDSQEYRYYLLLCELSLRLAEF